MIDIMGIQLTPGQRCLLDLLQRKLIITLQTYARLSSEKRETLQTGDGEQDQQQVIANESELYRLREKIKRISARQKRFTSEIINGNGNNTIPKESFFKALGLVTKETLSQLNSKSNERRRRTTANPRFSHEAIQAKKALQKPRSKNNKNNTSTTGDINHPKRLEILTDQERVGLYEEFKLVHQLIETKAAQVKDKIESSMRIEAENEKIFYALSKLKEDSSLNTHHRSLDTWFKCDESLDGLD